MSFRRESKDDAYDVIVVGAGMGGLSAAACLAKGGKKVLVVERHNVAGGYAHSFQRGKYKFDSAVHECPGCLPLEYGEGALVDDLLRAFGMRDRCTFIPLDPLYTAIYPDFRFNAPAGIQEFVEAHIEAFPHEERGLRKLVRQQTLINREVKRLPSDASPQEFSRSQDQFPMLAAGATLGEMMDEYLTDPRLKTLFSSLWGYLGLPPSRLAFSKWSSMLMSMLGAGTYYCKGTFQNLVNLFVEAVEKYGGEVLLRSTVRRILVKDGRAYGIMLDNGQRVEAPVVISNADPIQTFEELVGVEHLPSEYVSRVRGMKPSLSTIVVYMATKMDMHQFGTAHETVLYESWDHEDSYRKVLEGQPTGLLLSMPSLGDPNLCPPGETTVTVTTLMPYDKVPSWRNSKDEFVELILEQVERTFPGFRDSITFIEGASPRTMERYTLNYTGAVYGWEVSPEQAGALRMERRTPIEGLLMSSHWTQPGGGVISVMVSGVQTAQVLLDYPAVDTFLMALEKQ
jgi:phytoene desaturase